MRKVLTAVTAAVFVLSATTACNTVRGAGEDLESAADEVDEAT